MKEPNLVFDVSGEGEAPNIFGVAGDVSFEVVYCLYAVSLLKLYHLMDVLGRK